MSDSSTAAGFSAVGYWFGHELSHRLGVPIGIVQATLNGSSVSVWTHCYPGSTGSEYDNKLKPMQPYAIRGVNWYQGESNGGDTSYASKLSCLIDEWRNGWENPGAPFGIVQLPWRNNRGYVPIREAQLQVSETVPHTFLATTVDLPVDNQIHPSVKKPVGVRLALGARAVAYGENIAYSGPVRDPATSYVSGNKVVIKFAHLGNGLFTDNGAAPGPFKIARSNGRYHDATAYIVSDTVEVSNASISNPRFVRYIWDYSPGNLFSEVAVATEGGAVLVDRLLAPPFQLTIP